MSCPFPRRAIENISSAVGKSRLDLFRASSVFFLLKNFPQKKRLRQSRRVKKDMMFQETSILYPKGLFFSNRNLLERKIFGFKKVRRLLDPVLVRPYPIYRSADTYIKAQASRAKSFARLRFAIAASRAMPEDHTPSSFGWRGIVVFGGSTRRER